PHGAPPVGRQLLWRNHGSRIRARQEVYLFSFERWRQEDGRIDDNRRHYGLALCASFYLDLRVNLFGFPRETCSPGVDGCPAFRNTSRSRTSSGIQSEGTLDACCSKISCTAGRRVSDSG